MGKRRVKLIASRIEEGFRSQADLVAAIREQGVNIPPETYANIESGRAKKVDVIHAVAIAKVLHRSIEDIFLPISVQKIHQNNDRLVG
jgi:DNA-binding XRE family transcriptional regulator